MRSWLVVMVVAMILPAWVDAAPQPEPPPYSPSLPTLNEEQRAQEDVVPPARPSSEMEAERHPDLLPGGSIRGRIIGVDQTGHALSFATPRGPREVHVPKGAVFVVNGRPTSIENLPRDGRYEMRTRADRDRSIVELRSIDQHSGPDTANPPVPNEAIPP